ncbi:MAG TPA: carboxylesterase family protein [Streptosporangiaceae bacterium]
MAESRTARRLARHAVLAAAAGALLAGLAAGPASAGPGPIMAGLASPRTAGLTTAGGQPASSRPAVPRGAAPAPGLVVGTRDGAVRGQAAGAEHEFLGIPYAAPPVAALRWRPPAPPRPWPGIRPAAQFAPHCPQPASFFGVASTSEDCLYLNVFTPARSGGLTRGRTGGLPVLVWIHGGALVTGESDDYDPAALVRRGVIVVTLNYRIGALGFLADAALAGRPGGPAGNYGLMDQQAALRWVQANISRFGGDPRAVTLAGESAGGLSVLSQLASPAARGLFSRAIVESGSYNLNQASLPAAESAGQAFAAQAGCADPTAARTAACLRALPVAAVLASETASGYTPDVDGALLPRTLSQAFASGQFHRVPVLIGTNHDEWRLFVAESQLGGGPPVTAANYQAQIAATLGVPAAAAAAIAAQYPVSAFASAPVALGAAGTDAIFACPSLSASLSLSRYVPVYAYEFSDQSAPELFLPPAGFPYGAAHASELQYLFGLRSNFPAALTPAQQRLAAAMQGYWASFTRRAAPQAPGEPGWPRFAAAAPLVQSLAEPRPQPEASFAAEHHCAFWAQLAS